MTHKEPTRAKRNEYSFLGTKFRIPATELTEAIRQSGRLHRELIDDLMEEVERQAELLQQKRRSETKAGCSMPPGIE